MRVWRNPVGDLCKRQGFRKLLFATDLFSKEYHRAEQLLGVPTFAEVSVGIVKSKAGRLEAGIPLKTVKDQIYFLTRFLLVVRVGVCGSQSLARERAVFQRERSSSTCDRGIFGSNTFSTCHCLAMLLRFFQ